MNRNGTPVTPSLDELNAIQEAENIAKGAKPTEAGASHEGASPAQEDGTVPPGHGAPGGTAPTDDGSINLEALGLTQELIGEIGCALPQVLACWLYKISAPPVEEPLKTPMMKATLYSLRDAAPQLEKVSPIVAYGVLALLYLGVVGIKQAQWTQPEKPSSLDNQEAAKPPS